jgi:GDP-4-dehydro-6-deoxy-D-mannose reductase
MRYQRILLTGASGFVGSSLLKKLKEFNLNILAIGNDNAGSSLKSCDLTDRYAVCQMVESFRPDVVLHLAAVTDVTSDPETTWEVNFEGTRNLASSLKKFGPAPMVFASSTEIYGGSFADGRPKDESAPVDPRNTYARSKLSAEFLLRESYAPAAPVLSLRLGNHSGPGQRTKAVIPAFASQIAQIELSRRPGHILTGNLDTERQFMDIDDVVDAYLRAMDLVSEGDGFSVFNVSSDEPVRISRVLDLLLKQATVPVSADPDPSRMRPSDIPRAFADASAFKRATGWSCETPLEFTVTDVLNHWRIRKADGRGFSVRTGGAR